ncbi:MAG: DMT family transporter [Rhizobiaceae bacterium]|nr:DMT family transporter [Rhizobiaceae bacterium]
MEQGFDARGTAEMAAAMLIAGTIGWFVLMTGLPVTEVVFWRCLIGAAVMLPLAAAAGRFNLGGVTPAVLALAALGGVAIVANWLLLFASYAHASISVATVLYNTQPLMLVGFGVVLFGERMTPRKGMWLAIAFAGMVLVVQAKPGGSYADGDILVGAGLALAAALLYAVAAVIAKKLRGVSPYLITLIQTLVGTVLLAPLATFGALPHAGPQWMALIAIGAVHTGLMYVLLYSAIQRLPTGVTASLSFIYPVAAIAVDFAALGVRLHPVQFAGSALILLAAAGMQLGWRIGRSGATLPAE